MAATGDGERSDILAFLVGGLVGAVLIGLAWLGASVLTSDSDTDAGGSRDGARLSRTDVRNPGAYQAPTQTYLDRCLEVYDAQNAPLAAVGPALSQWEVHIGAMNKLVVGAITLDQARQFWSQTRVGAHARLEDYRRAHDAFERRTSRCPPPGSLAQTEPALRKCHRAVEARGHAIRLATVTLDTWRMHVHHMEMFRRGEMTPAEATRLWLQNWHRGVREVRAYKEAAREARGKSC